MGMATILRARRIVLLATGAGKARCVARMIDGPVTPRLPASFLQLHRDVEVWVDRAAASRLSRAP
jgi:glucosamine-6-phosphate deaminase